MLFFLVICLMTHESQFLALDRILFECQQYWQIVAFEHDCLPWPQLIPVLMQLSDQELAQLEHDPKQLTHFLRPYIPQLNQLDALLALPIKPLTNITWPFWLENGIKGRKLDQLKNFVAAVSEQALPVLEWCAGKGHLGRMLAFSGAPKIHSVELQANLCEQGNSLAQKYQLNITFSQADVLAPEAKNLVQSKQHAVALHACGALHQQLMRHAVANKTEKMTISPCCYHLIADDYYQAMSAVGAQSRLKLSRHDLKLALQETVTAANRITVLRQTEVEWRLAFDALQREVFGTDTYLPVPSAQKALFTGEFADFCHWAANKKSLQLPESLDYQKYLELGLQRKKVADRIELVRHAFRRAIELWLVFDRVLFLQEQGYAVEVAEFCDKVVTPRNVLIQAHKIK